MGSEGKERSKSPRRSRSPNERRRSRSPDRRKQRKSGGGGFKWKDKSAKEPKDSKDDYRDRSDGYRPNRYRKDEDDPSKSRDYRRSDRDFRSENEIPKPDDSSGKRKQERREKKEKSSATDDTKKPVKTQATSTAASTFITVFVNDRLGTRAQIPCLPSDTIGLSYFFNNHI